MAVGIPAAADTKPTGANASAGANANAGTIGAAQARTLPGLFAQRVARTPHAIAYSEVADGAWRAHSWSDMAHAVSRWRAGLAGEGLAAGERVAMGLPNGVDWVCFDQAALALGLVTVPLYATDSPGNRAYILADAGARLLLLDDDAQWAALLAHGTPLPALQRVLCRRHTGTCDEARLQAVDDWLPGRGDGEVSPKAALNVAA
jgi:Long-chain acyl-CoA synthetases (AMP-forming)